MWHVISREAWTSQCGAALPDLHLLLAMFHFHTVALVSHMLGRRSLSSAVAQVGSAAGPEAGLDAERPLGRIDHAEQRAGHGDARMARPAGEHRERHRLAARDVEDPRNRSLGRSPDRARDVLVGDERADRIESEGSHP